MSHSDERERGGGGTDGVLYPSYRQDGTERHHHCSRIDPKTKTIDVPAPSDTNPGTTSVKNSIAGIVRLTARSFSMPGGQAIHRFSPYTTAFHAPLWQCGCDPLPAGPKIHSKTPDLVVASSPTAAGLSTDRDTISGTPKSLPSLWFSSVLNTYLNGMRQVNGRKPHVSINVVACYRPREEHGWRYFQQTQYGLH